MIAVFTKDEIKEFVEARYELEKLARFAKHSAWMWLFIGSFWGVLALLMIGTLISDDFRIFINELFNYGI